MTYLEAMAEAMRRSGVPAASAEKSIRVTEQNNGHALKKLGDIEAGGEESVISALMLVGQTVRKEMERNHRNN